MSTTYSPEAQATIKRLNRRTQEAEAALRDASEVISHMKSNPWCGGSLGRAMLAWENSVFRAYLGEDGVKAAFEAHLASPAL